MQVSIMCRYAHFMKTVPETTLVHNVPDEYTGVVWTITNPGAPVGFFVQGWSDTQFSEFYVHNETNGQLLRVKNARDATGTRWRFDIDTTPENRRVRKLAYRDNQWWFYDMYDNFKLESGYPQLESGVNVIKAHIFGGTNKKFELTYTQRFHGV